MHYREINSSVTNYTCCISSRAICLLPGSSHKDRIPQSFLDIRTRCNSIPGLTREQVKLCYQATDVTTIALDGLDLAINECQFQVGRSAREEHPNSSSNPNNCYASLPSHVHGVHAVSIVPLELLVAEQKEQEPALVNATETR